ncbi:MAG: CvpA family protein [Saprospiraceae bacterium]
MILDIVTVLIVAFGFYTGYSRGLIKTVFDTLSLLIGILAAMKLSSYAIDLLESVFNISPAINNLLGLVITFLVVMAVIRFVGRKLEGILKATNINVVNKLAGGVLQGLFFAFLLSLIVFTLNNYNVIKKETIESSITFPVLKPLPEAGKSIFVAAKPIFSDFWNRTVEAMESLEDKSETEQ